MGVKEESDESTDKLIMDMASNNLEVVAAPADIDRSHRLGPKRTDGEPTFIIVKFTFGLSVPEGN